MMQRLAQFGATLSGGLRRVTGDGSVREAAVAFVLTRFVVFAVFIITGAASLDSTAPDFNRDDPHPRSSIRPQEVKKQLEHTLMRGDSGWYVEIARRGYDRAAFETTKQHNWVFFPLYPMVVRLAAGWTGEFLIWGALLSNGLFFLALILLHKLVTSLGDDKPTADRAVFYTAIFPVSYFFSLPMTESLFLCLNMASFLAAARGRWWLAGVCGGLSSAARVNGVLLVPVLALFYLQQTDRSKWRGDVLWLALVPVGLLTFMFFLWKITGNPLAFIDAQAAWQRKGGFFLLTLYEYIKSPLKVIEPWNFRALHFGAAILALGAAFFWARRKEWAFAVLTFLSILLPLSLGGLHSTTRYVAVIFPVFIALAVAGRELWVDRAICVVFLALFGLLTLCYALRFSFASA